MGVSREQAKSWHWLRYMDLPKWALGWEQGPSGPWAVREVAVWGAVSRHRQPLGTEGSMPERSQVTMVMHILDPSKGAPKTCMAQIAKLSDAFNLVQEKKTCKSRIRQGFWRSLSKMKVKYRCFQINKNIGNIRRSNIKGCSFAIRKMIPDYKEDKWTGGLCWYQHCKIVKMSFKILIALHVGFNSWQS